MQWKRLQTSLNFKIVVDKNGWIFYCVHLVARCGECGAKRLFPQSVFIVCQFIITLLALAFPPFIDTPPSAQFAITLISLSKCCWFVLLNFCFCHNSCSNSEVFNGFHTKMGCLICAEPISKKKELVISGNIDSRRFGESARQFCWFSEKINKSSGYLWSSAFHRARQRTADATICVCVCQ